MQYTETDLVCHQYTDTPRRFSVSQYKSVFFGSKNLGFERIIVIPEDLSNTTLQKPLHECLPVHHITRPLEIGTHQWKYTCHRIGIERFWQSMSCICSRTLILSNSTLIVTIEHSTMEFYEARTVTCRFWGYKPLKARVISTLRLENSFLSNHQVVPY